MSDLLVELSELLAKQFYAMAEGHLNVDNDAYDAFSDAADALSDVVEVLRNG